MEDKVKCPECGCLNAIVVNDEVDIGVGVMKHPLYIECPECGNVEIPTYVPKPKNYESKE